MTFMPIGSISYAPLDSGVVSAYAATVQAATAIILVILTLLYVRLTARMVSEVRAARQPTVFVDLEIQDASLVILIIGNSGDAAARHMTFEIEDGIPWKGEPIYAPSELPAIKNGIPYLAPGRALRFELGWLDWDQATKRSGWLNVKIRFEGEQGRKFLHPANIDLRRYDGLRVDTFARHDADVAKALQDMVWLATDVTGRDKANSTTQWCPSCARPMPYSAKKCAECGEWRPSAEPTPAVIRQSNQHATSGDSDGQE